MLTQNSVGVFAVVVGSLSAVTTLIYGIPFLKSYWGFGWDFVLFVLWTAVFGVFGNIFIKASPTPEQHGVQRMKNAVWIDLINMLLWFATAIYSTFIVSKPTGKRVEAARDRSACLGADAQHLP